MITVQIYTTFFKQFPYFSGIFHNFTEVFQIAGERHHGKKEYMERTLVILKPGTLQRGLVGEVISRFEKRGLKLVAMKMKQLDSGILDEHYSHLKERPFFPWLKAGMMAAPVILCCWEGFEAVKTVREMAGATNSRKAAPGTIRGDYGMSSQENIVHTSDSPENARIELDRFFSPEDYCEYPSPLRQYLYAPDEK